jgi:hypothetical protein
MQPLLLPAHLICSRSYSIGLVPLVLSLHYLTLLPPDLFLPELLLLQEPPDLFAPGWWWYWYAPLLLLRMSLSSPLPLLLFCICRPSLSPASWFPCTAPPSPLGLCLHLHSPALPWFVFAFAGLPSHWPPGSRRWCCHATTAVVVVAAAVAVAATARMCALRLAASGSCVSTLCSPALLFVVPHHHLPVIA